jgi:hypothetical protein
MDAPAKGAAPAGRGALAASGPGGGAPPAAADARLDALLRKVGWHLVPLCAAVIFISNLDRSK